MATLPFDGERCEAVLAVRREGSRQLSGETRRRMSAGKRGTIAGVAVAVGVAVVYWTVSGLFEAMGNISQLPPVLAAWSPDLIFAFIGGYLILRVPT